MHKFDKNPCMDFKGELCSERNATQRNATQRNATQRNATQRNAILPLYLMGKSLFGIPVLYFPSLCRKITESHPCLYRDMVL
ncbi:hypothetical protein TUM15778_01140 [Neisseria gonorrhoeae]|nr:hypothetical protein DFR77_101120 [Neisseria gonorrhoeae]CEZ96717.1 Uncharacterised protein [Neisseria gonorrhoeae]CFH34841.1 Uncharacterised protein [Neisseria gonorrhoeae]CNP04633.1 Uncharacterised protein [Neisseria gonorrhoeae]CNP09035.1 Uncharacterised protein [Neisseria gonorrhoeae]